MDVPFMRPMLGPEEEAGVLRVLRSGHLISGPEVKALERELIPVTGAEYNVAVSSATAGLHLALHALGCGHLRAVLPAMTHVGTLDAVRMCGAKPILYDVDPTTLLLDAPTGLLVTTTVVPVDLYGNLAPPVRHGGTVVIDAAHSIGTRRHPDWANATVYSLHAMKNITSGEGGIIATNNPHLARELRLLREHGQDREHEDRPFLVRGFKYNMPDILAAIVRAQIPKLPGFLARRRELLHRYERALAGWCPFVPHGTDASPHLFVIRVPDRDRVRRRLQGHGVGTVIQYPSLSTLAAYKERVVNQVRPVAEQAGREVISLPLWPGMTDVEQAHVTTSLRGTLEELR